MKKILISIVFFTICIVGSYYYGYSAGKNEATNVFFKNSYKVTLKARELSEKLKNSFEQMTSKESELKNDEECSKYLFDPIPPECVRKSTAYYKKFL